MRPFLAACLLATCPASAGSQIQSSWTSGPGVPGPVTSWGGCFFSETSIFYWNVDGLEVEYPTCSVGPADWAWSVALADVDCDGDGDAVVASRLADHVIWFENVGGSGATWTEHEIGYAPDVVSVDAGDLDGDGDPDIVSACAEANDLAWWKSTVTATGVIWNKYAIDVNYPSAGDAIARDVDGDGDLDVIATSWSSHSAAWWENTTGMGTAWTKHSIGVGPVGPRALQAEDLDGDGDRDVVAVASENDSVIWWENDDGTGSSWTRWVLSMEFDGWGVYVADIDGDFDNDIIACSYAPGSVIWLENPGQAPGTAWPQHVVDSGVDGFTSVTTEDVEGDGDQDVIASAFGECTSWWENMDGAGITWLEHHILAGGGWSLYSGDIDNDRFVDVLGGSSSIVRLWKLEYPPTASLESSVLYLGDDPGWGALDWDATLPSNSSLVCFQARASDIPGQMGAWSDTLFEPCALDSVLDPFDSYFQYRAILKAGGPFDSPVLHSVELSWDAVGVGEGCAPVPAGPLLFRVAPCPVTGPFFVRFCLACRSSASLSVFDSSGRLVEEASGEFTQGQSESAFPALTPGVYFVRMTAGDYEAVERFVVVE